MRMILVLLTFALSLAAMADTYDNQVTVCKKQSIELSLSGKSGLFSPRTLNLRKDGQLILQEKYSVENYDYNEHSAETVLQVPPEFNQIQKVAYKVRPKSVSFDMEWIFRVSENTIVYQTYSSLNPKFGGETSALILLMVRSNQFVVFDMTKDCKVNGRSVVW